MRKSMTTLSKLKPVQNRFKKGEDGAVTLKDPDKRAQYDIQHKNHWDFDRKLAEEASDSKLIERDVDIQDKLLSILYVKRRQNANEPGMSNFELQRLLGCPPEDLEFHVWYLRGKGWIGRGEDCMLAITVEGVDRAKSERHRETAKITDRSEPDRLRF